MPSLRHEAPLELLRRTPALIAELARQLAGLPVPASTGASVSEAELGRIEPTTRTVDLVIELEAGGATVMAFIVECQLNPDPTKLTRWPYYVAALHDRLGCPVVLVVLAADDAVASWAQRPAPTLGPCLAFRPVVLGPAQIPRITDAARAHALPELAVLSAIAHGSNPDGFAIARAALDGLGAVDPGRGSLYLSIILGTVNDATRRALEAYMESNRERFFFSDWERRHFERGEEQGREQGRVQGREQERAALTQRARRSLRKALAIRFGDVPDDLTAAIERCDDVDRLLDWVAELGACESLEAARRMIVD